MLRLAFALILLGPSLSMGQPLQCPKGFQPVASRCVTQRMADYISCIEVSGGNRQAISEELTQIGGDKNSKNINASGGNAIAKGNAGITLDAKSETALIKRLETRWFPGGTSECAKVLQLQHSTNTQKHQEYSQFISYSWTKNYWELYFSKNGDQRKIKNITNKLSILNVSQNYLTNLSVRVYFYKNNANYSEYFRFYDLTPANYVQIFSLTQPALQPGAQLEVSMRDVIKTFSNSQPTDPEKEVGLFLFPSVNSPISADIEISGQGADANQIFTRNKELLKQQFQGTISNANDAKGFRLKMVVSYTNQGVKYDDLLVGGMFFYVNNNVAINAVTDSMIKMSYTTRYSMALDKPLADLYLPAQIGVVGTTNVLANSDKKTIWAGYRAKGSNKFVLGLPITLELLAAKDHL